MSVFDHCGLDFLYPPGKATLYTCSSVLPHKFYYNFHIYLNFYTSNLVPFKTLTLSGRAISHLANGTFGE